MDLTNRMEQRDVLILGAGFSGLSAAVELDRRGRRSFLILEKADDVGGTWRDNTYPGAECDVPSHLYSLSYAPNPGWSKTYGTGPEIHEYQRGCVERFGLADRIQFGAHAETAAWRGDHWEVTTRDGRSFEGRFLIAGVGGLHTPNIPDLPGASDFAGPTFHTARWDHGVELRGRRVGMIGTGATAVQAAPEVARMASAFHLFQRSPIWCGPKRDEPYSPELQEEFGRDPELLRRHRWDLWRAWETSAVDLFHAGTEVNRAAEEAARRNISDHVRDPELVVKLTPTYNFTCKRPTFSNRYYPMFNLPNVHLETDAIERVTADGVVVGATVVPLDVLIYATGFLPFDITTELDVVGLEGQRLSDAWSERVTSYRSVMMHGFPNLFFLLGPNSAGLTSALQMIEAGARFAVRVIEHVERTGAAAVHPTRQAVDEFSGLVDELLTDTTVNKGCSSWWTRDGGNHALWPASSVRYRMMLNEVRPRELLVVSAP